MRPTAVFVLFLALPFAATAATFEPDPAAALREVRFEANQGQGHAGAAFVARASGRAIAFDDESLALRLGGGIVRLRFAAPGARPEARLHEPLPGATHYLLGNDRSRWVTGVEGFGRLDYRGVAPGVDARFYGRGAELEFDLVLEAGVDPRRVELAVEGADDLSLDDEGRLVVARNGDTLAL
ncbi:MAG: hypothetical protein R3190_14485, partial [Thermoanaerobaculia bacterium]|nr:hypothetical protein [Thermoanaerobaculia bacterium]